MLYIIALVVLVFFASIISATAGFGTSTVMIPILLLFFPHSEVLIFVGMLDLFVNIWKIFFFRGHVFWFLVLTFGIAGIFAGIMGALFTFSIPTDIFYRLIGVLIIAYVGFLYFWPTFVLPSTKETAIAGGIAYGLSAGIFGIGGVFRSIIFTAFNLPKATYLATHGVIGTLVGITRLSVYFMQKTVSYTLWIGLLICIPVTFVGAKVGQMIVHKIPQVIFRKVVAVFLCLIGFKLIFFP